ncbi:MAG: outer membrane lipoprotein carrier protein LolA [Taibaiella sp.]|nr:outer membrane lipoprotein carrier protein LolA [Taibaiella sp.]
MRSISFIVFLFLSLGAGAQPAGYKKLADVNSFKTELSKANAAVKNISSDFKQVKNLSLLAEKIHSKGKFYFMKPGMVRIEYTEPYYYLMVMNGSRMLVKDEQKSNKINAGSSKMMQSVNRVMVDCMQGTVFTNPDFKTTAYHDGNRYLLSLVPATADMKKLFEQIDVYMNKSGMDVVKLVLTETGGDFTAMEFYNTKHNLSLNETLFKVK